jgi:hypothetical protein
MFPVGDRGSAGKPPAQSREVLQDILDRLGKSENPLTLFAALMDKTSEDKSFSGVSGGKGKEFDSAYRRLKEHEYSGIVKTSEGSYIIMRMPVSPELTVNSAGDTLRYWTAYNGLFKNRVEGRCAKMKIEYKDAYYGIDVEKLLRNL